MSTSSRSNNKNPSLPPQNAARIKASPRVPKRHTGTVIPEGQPPENQPQYNHLTISEDQSQGSAIEERRLLALRQREDTPKSNPENPRKEPRGHTGRVARPDKSSPGPVAGSSSIEHPQTHGNHALQDYQMQLMLAEQQNKRRLLAKREKEKGVDSDLPSPRRPTRASLTSSIGNLAKIAEIDKTTRSDQHQFKMDDDDLSTLEVQALREQVIFLKAKLKKYESTHSTLKPSRLQLLYRLNDPTSEGNPNSDDDENKSLVSTPFMDCPDIVYNQRGAAHLRCNVPLRNFDLFLALNRDVSFVVFRDYKKECPLPRSKNDQTPQLPRPTSESVYPVASDLKAALDAILNKKPEFSDLQKQYKESGELHAPYLFIYHSRQDMEEIRNELSAAAIDQLNLFMEYVKLEFGEEYETADCLLTQKKIIPNYIKYLFKPGDILVEKIKNDYTGYIAESWISDEIQKSEPPKSINIFDQLGDISPRQKPKTEYHQNVKAWTFEFNGSFYRRSTTLGLKLSLEEYLKITKISPEKQTREDMMREAKLIANLNVFPLKYAPEAVFKTLQRRGNTFWKCRTRRLVSYQANENEQVTDLAEERYMIDMKTYSKLHTTIRHSGDSEEEDLDTEEIGHDDQPDKTFQFLLPLTLKGYNLRRKKWYDISADRISDVTWNEEAFQTLVVERNSKDLIQALVTSQLEAEKSTDLIAGKGNGLILLLHGGPGTGKTLTAESVAEIAQKPLYRVTCGDVGTKAVEVEKYLESVLYLGRIWGCVVLLDEADIFLEQRSLEDLERNALVSVFLRVLEYYDGILILTSNRVGTFDEAFRSRIQLALHYPNLGPTQRFRIWQTFIDRLDSLEDEPIDVADLRDHLHILQEEKLNGRQIRNVITTARQYARWKKITLTYKHLKEVIQISGRFDDYLDKLHGGFSPDDLAQDDGLRLA